MDKSKSKDEAPVSKYFALIYLRVADSNKSKNLCTRTVYMMFFIFEKQNSCCTKYFALYN